MKRRETTFRAVANRLFVTLGVASAALFAGAGLVAQSGAERLPTIIGTVIDDSGAPAGGVEVVLRPHPSAFQADLYLFGHADVLPEAVDRTASDAEGVFSLRAPATGPYMLEFGQPPLPDEPGRALPLVRGVVVPLKGSRVAESVDLPNRHLAAVRVLDVDDEPIEDALVVAAPTVRVSPRTLDALTRMASGLRSGDYSPPRAQLISPTYHPSASRTGADGVARIAMPTPDATFVVSARGFALGKSRTRSGRAALRLERDPGVRLRVRGPTGDPAPGALVRTASARGRLRNAGADGALALLGTPGAMGGSDTPLAVTDKNGETVIGRMPGAETALEVETADGAFARVLLPATDGGATPGSPQTMDVQLEEALRLSGRIVDAASGLPIHNAAIWVQPFPGHHAFSDAAGAFDITTRPTSGGTLLQATATGYLGERIDISVADLSRREEVRIGLTPSAPIRGFVTDAAGRPVAGASIRAEPRGSGVLSVSSFMSGPATSDAAGAFEVEEARYGQAYRLTAQAAGYAASARDLAPFEPDELAEPVRLALSKGRRVLGTVVDTDGAPVAEAQVALLWPLDPSDFRSLSEAPAAAATTDAGGAFVLPAIGPGEYEVRVGHTDYAKRPISRVEVPAGEPDFDFGSVTLAKGGTILGIVRDPDGSPVGGATVRALAPRRIRAVIRTATTDADGLFRLDGFASDLADLSVRAAGYPVRVQPNVSVGDPDRVSVELRPGASAHGRVLDGAGNGVAGVPVRLRRKLDHGSGGNPRLLDVADMFPRRVTDKEGRFRFDGLAAGAWSAETRKGAEGAKLEGIDLVAGKEREIELVLRTRDLLTVIVTTEVGEPVAGAEITLESAGERLPVAYGSTDGSGRSVMDIRPGIVTVEVSHDELRDQSQEVRLEAGDNEVRFRLRPGLELSGTVRSDRGAPLALATVEAETEYSSGARFHQTNTVSDQNGVFRLTGLEPLAYVITARSPGYADGGPDEPSRLGEEAVDGVEIVLAPEAAIVGRVTGLSPSALNQVRVWARKGPRYRDAALDNDGSFAVQGTGPGTWEVRAIKGDWERTVERTVTIEQGAAEVFVELPFESGLRLSGEVHEAGAPLVGARLRVGGQSTRTDQEGRFAFEGLEPGLKQVVVSRSDLSGTRYQSIDLHTDQEGVRIELESAAATVSGVVVDAETGEPLEYASLMAGAAETIDALAAQGGAGGPLADVSTTLSLDGGRFELELGASADRLQVTRDGYEIVRLPLDIAPGEHIEGFVIRLQPAPGDAPEP